MAQRLPATPASTLDIAVADLVATLREHGMPSARNLLVTVFGDVVAPRGVAVPVQSLAAMLEPLGVSERLVRTSLLRLVRDEILRNERVGRRSLYSIDPTASSMFDHAERRIYHRPGDREREWDGRWTLAVVDSSASTAARRAALRRELGWLGMGTVTPNVLASPSLDPATVAAELERIGGEHHVLVMRGDSAPGASTMTDEEIARRSAPVDDLSRHYHEVIGWFRPVADAFDATPDRSPRDCWLVRLLLIAVFRRVALADPRLPDRLLPDPWAGATARDLAGAVYGRVHAPAEEWLAQVVSDRLTEWPMAVGRGDRFRG